MARCAWQAAAVIAAILAWRIFADDFATSAIAAAAVYLMVNAVAELRYGPAVTIQDARSEVVDFLQARDRN